MNPQSAISWLSAILTGAQQVAAIIHQFQQDGNSNPSADEVAEALANSDAADAGWAEALARLRAAG